MSESFIFNIYKPVGISSFQVIRQLRSLTGIRKIGHAGTLDPLAEGVLVVGVTREGTRQLSALLLCDKEYRAEIKLGANTTTGDREGKERIVVVSKVPSKKDVQEVLKQFVGEIWQKPHLYSAIKIKGQPAYRRIRAGQTLEIKPKKVSIHSIRLLSYQYPLIEIKASVSSGVYIRSLAVDLGKQLKTGAYVTKLVRTRVGKYSLSQSKMVEAVAKLVLQRNQLGKTENGA
ncbi:MAG TPA: tRNA pseudouridine(55) synthase TruB [Candidatus Woesebacteria bacterium]|nr:tRNA pseudouridine(55) synthase TruB [Candidatus Woesebacteria bacterium]